MKTPLEVNIITWKVFKKAVEGKLTAGEQADFDHWLNVSASNQKHFNDALRYYEKQVSMSEEGETRDEINIAPVWNDFERYTKKGRTLFRLKIAAAITLLIVSTAVIIKQFQEDPSALIVENSVKPGKPIAMLTIGDGDAMLLEEQDTMVEVSGSSLSFSVKSGTIAYHKNFTAKGNQPVLHRLSIPRGGEYKVELPDESIMHINSETVVEYYVPFKDGNRDLYVNGEVYIEVEKDPLHPFHITTNDYTVQVLGTSFNVCAYPEDNFSATTLVSGSVKIVGLKGANHKKEIILEPNQQLYLDENKQEVAIRSVEAAKYTAWTKGDFVFEEETLYSIFNKLKRWYDVDVSFVNKEAEHEYFSGKLPRFDNLEDLLSIINRVSVSKLKLKGGTVIIE